MDTSKWTNLLRKSCLGKWSRNIRGFKLAGYNQRYIVTTLFHTVWMVVGGQWLLWWSETICFGLFVSVWQFIWEGRCVVPGCRFTRRSLSKCIRLTCLENRAMSFSNPAKTKFKWQIIKITVFLMSGTGLFQIHFYAAVHQNGTRNTKLCWIK